MTKRHVVRCLVLAALLLVGPLMAAAQTAGDTGQGRRVDFELTPFRDTLFTGVEGSLRARFDAAGHVWYTTEGGVVHVDPANATRELFTKVEGLPSSYSLGLDISGRNVFVGTDLGLAIIDRTSGAVTAVTRGNSPIPDDIVQDVNVVGQDLWLGLRFGGVAVWNTTRPFSEPDAWVVKNTSTTTKAPLPVNRIVDQPSAIYVGTEGDGLWRYDRARGTWSVTVLADGIPSNIVLGAVERGSELWVGTSRGLAMKNGSSPWRVYTTAHGMPDDRVNDVDLITTVQGTRDVFAATRRGIWHLEPASGLNETLAQNAGILGAHVLDHETVAGQGELFASMRGVSLNRAGSWSYFTTGPTDGPSWGPLTFGFTSASVGDQNGFLWFGSQRGLSAYRLPAADEPGYWQNFGPWQSYPGSVINWIDTEGNVTWFGTNIGAYGFEHDTGRWIPLLLPNSRNLIYSLEAEGDEVWVAHFGEGLAMNDRKTGIVRRWNETAAVDPLPDAYLTEVRIEDGNVWVGSGVGLLRMDRSSGTLRATYTSADGIPDNGVIYRIEPDGAVLWLGTPRGGVAMFNVAQGNVTRVWNATTEPGFPNAQVRSLHREGGRLWVGTTEGLVRIDVTTGAWKAWNQTGTDLVQNYVNGITSAQGLLYLATLSGVQRMDIAAERFLPMYDGPGVIRVDASELGAAPARVAVRIHSPRDGGAITGETEVRGSAFALGGKVDRVEVRVGEGAFQPALGTESWTFGIDANAHAPNAPLTITARAISGNLTSDAEIVVTPVPPPKVPLRVEELPPGEAYANRPFRIAARAQGDDPLTVTAFYRAPDAPGYARLPMTRTGDLFTASVPARDMREGELRYFVEAQSGLLVASAAGDAQDPTVVVVQPAPRLAVAIEGPALLEAKAGETTRFPLNVTNAGTEAATFRVEASGLRSSWVGVPPNDIELAPGATHALNVSLIVPAAAFADNTTLTFVARDSAGQADPATARVPVRILAADAAPTPPTRENGRSFLPLSPALALAAAAVAVALLGRRRA